VGELLAVIAVVSILAGVPGLSIMLAAELALYNIAQSNSFTFEAGNYILRDARRPHVLRGSDRGHDVVVTYCLGARPSLGGDRGISTISYSIPPHPKIHLRVAPRSWFGKRSHRAGVPEFDNRVTASGGPKAFIDALLADAGVRSRLKDTISPPYRFSSTLTITQAGPLLLRHKSLFLRSERIRSDIELLGDIARILEDHLGSSG
jgi:hypothetical protein